MESKNGLINLACGKISRKLLLSDCGELDATIEVSVTSAVVDSPNIPVVAVCSVLCVAVVVATVVLVLGGTSDISGKYTHTHQSRKWK